MCVLIVYIRKCKKMKKKMNNSSFINASSISNDADKITFFRKKKKRADVGNWENSQSTHIEKRPW
jgi:hypothetical protein